MKQRSVLAVASLALGGAGAIGKLREIMALDDLAAASWWYDQGYQTPEGGWGQYDIHHIIPREYGGTNDFWNLTPVLRSVHQTDFNP